MTEHENIQVCIYSTLLCIHLSTYICVHTQALGSLGSPVQNGGGPGEGRQPVLLAHTSHRLRASEAELRPGPQGPRQGCVGFIGAPV